VGPLLVILTLSGFVTSSGAHVVAVDETPRWSGPPRVET
jgi:hypothetical protein